MTQIDTLSDMVAKSVGLFGGIKSASFASFTYRKGPDVKGANELAKYHLILGAHTANQYKDDLAELELLLPTFAQNSDAWIACKELIDSRNESLTVGIGNNSRYTCKDTYIHVQHLKGVRVHSGRKEDGSISYDKAGRPMAGRIYVTGLCENKIVLEPGEPLKPVKSSPKTIEKNKIREQLKSSRFREFIIGNLERVALNGEILEFSNVVTA